MMADRGTPLVAIEDGTVGRLSDGGLGGITVWLIGASGTEYYYAHLDAWAPGLATGMAVGIGGSLGTVGSTGNAPEEWPHLHFEIHPDGGSAVNPYPTVAAICP
jgi:murein DD-endopeptidase MepM/ murein hydrolase activator NlpD